MHVKLGLPGSEQSAGWPTILLLSWSPCTSARNLHICLSFASAGRLSEGQPRHGCVPLTNQEEVQDSFVILERGTCMFAAKVS